MTLCIGALAQDAGRPRIVLCFDSKVSAEEFASETEYKFHRLSSQLCSVFAGAPGRAKEVAWIYREYLKSNPLNKQTVIEQLREPLVTYKKRLANSYIGRTLGLTYQAVLEHGRQWFGEDHQQRLLNIENHDLKLNLIIAGFIGYFPVLCEMKEGELEWKTGFSLIGSGAYTAEPAMHAREQQDGTPLYSSMYNVFEAKKFGESSPFVGNHTSMFVLHPPDINGQSIRIDVVTPNGFKHLESLYGEYGPKRVPNLFEFPADGLIRGQ